MVRYYNTYCDNVIVATLSRQISWSNNILIFYKMLKKDGEQLRLRKGKKTDYFK